MHLLRLAVLVLSLAVDAASAATQMGSQDHAHDRRRQAQIAYIARSVLPLPVLTVHRSSTRDRAELYTVHLDAREIVGAPKPIITTQILIARGATGDMIALAMRAAAEEIRELVERAEGKAPRNPALILRPDLVK